MTSYGGPELARAFGTVRTNTLQIAEDIPEDKYDFAPAPGVRTVGATLVHIAFGSSLQDELHRTRRLTTLQGYDFGAYTARLAAEERKPRSKADIVALLQSHRDDFAGWLESLSPEFLAETYTDPAGQNPRTRLEGLLAVKEHEMHHRAQLMLVERILGIVPHLTRQMEARIAARAAAKQ